jgi:hypothetical protein
MGVKPGLWESRVVKQVRDGQDMTAQVKDATAAMQERLANLPPEQREKILAYMKDHAPPPTPAGNGTTQICITADRAREDSPPLDRQGCEPSTVKRSGNHTTFEFSCTRNGTTTTGKGESTITSDVISTVSDVTTQRANGDSHVMHTEIEMKFIGADCGNVKPLPSNASPPGAAPPNTSH